METNKTIFRHVPNFLTSMNVLCGCISVTLTLQNPKYMVISALFIAIASVFDFLDGMSARMLKAYSAIGKELDSLADMVSFGLAPSVIMFQLIKASLYNGAADITSYCSCQGFKPYIPFVAFVIAIFSALRLAKFNIDTRQTESFIGLATPPNAILIASIPVVMHFYPEYEIIRTIFTNTFVLIPMACVLSLLLVSEFPMFSLKVKHLKWQGNQMRFILLASILILLISLQGLALIFIVPIYILLSFLNNILFTSRKETEAQK